MEFKILIERNDGNYYSEELPYLNFEVGIYKR